MKRQLVSMGWLIAIVLSFMAPAIHAGDKIEFEPITDADWAVKEDSAKGIHGAAMLFDKIWVNDENWYKNEVTVTYYRRIRVVSDAGKDQGDIVMPFLSKSQKVESVLGRTVRHDGTITLLDKAQVIEKEVVKAEGVKVKQKSFSLPGVSNDCILEYIIRIQLKNQFFNFWTIQKDIYLFKGVLDWKLFRGKGYEAGVFEQFASKFVPQHIAMNLPRNLDVQKLPKPDQIDELVFTVADVPAFKTEPNSLPSNALRAQMRFFYVDYNAAGLFWSNESELIGKWCNDYSAKSDQCKLIAKQFDTLKTEQEKILAVYRWLQTHIKNTTFMKQSELDQIKPKFESADQALKGTYADRGSINYLFRQILRELKIQAQIAWVVDRDEDLVVQEAKYWQFDRSIVAIPSGRDVYDFYSPGDQFMPPGMVPWYCEGASALMENATGLMFQVVPFSPSNDNTITRAVQLVLDSELALSGTVTETRAGHSARWVRRELADAPQSEWPDKVKKVIKDRFVNLESDSSWYSGCDSTETPLVLGARVSFASAEQGLAGQRLLLKPLDYLGAVDNPFIADKRKTPIMLDYAYEKEETLTLAFPTGWSVEGLPRDTTFQNPVGKCALHFSQSAGALTVERTFKLTTPFVQVASYPQVRQLFETYVSLSSRTVMLNQTQQ